MDRALPAEEVPADLLAIEIRHSALLLGGALGLMGVLALALLLVTARYGG